MSKTSSRVWNTGIMFSGLAATIIGSRLGADTATLACTSGLLSYLASLAGSQAHGFLKDLWEKKPAPEADEVFRNHHIRSLLTAAARAVIQDATARVREDKGKASQALIDAAETLPEDFAQELESADSPLASLSDFHAPDLLTRYASAQGQTPLLTPEIWRAFISLHVLLSEAEAQALAQGFHTRFGEALWNLVKMDAATDKQGYAAVELLFHTRLLQAVQGTRKSIAPIKKRVTRLIRSLDEKQTRHFQALLQGNAELKAQLDTHAASFHRHLGAVHKTVKKVAKGVKGVGRGVKRMEKKLDDLTANQLHIAALTSYKANLTARFAIHNAVGIPAVEDPKQKQGPDKIVDLFVQPTCTEQRVSPEEMQEDQKQGKTKAEALLPRLVKHRRVVLLADPGMGKSTLTQWLVTALAAPVPSKDIAPFGKAIPLPIILREVVRDMPRELKKWTWATLLETFLRHRHDEHKPAMAAPLAGDDTTWPTLLASPQAWFMLDGLDEIGDPAKRRALRNAIWEGFEAHPEARFLITSRVVGYEEAEVHRAICFDPGEDTDSDPVKESIRQSATKHRSGLRLIGYNQRGAFPKSEDLLSLTTLLYLAPWDNTQQRDFSQHWFRLRLGESEGSVRAREFVKAVHGHPSTGTIGRVPNLLLLMALLYRHRASLPHGRAKVYAGISQAYLESIADVRRIDHRSGSAIPYTLAEKERLLAIIAMHMQVRRVGRNDEEEDEAKGEVIASRSDLEAWLCPEFGRGEDAENVAEMERFITHIADSSGLLLPRGQDLYAFAHLSFQEYYTACWLEREFRRLLNLKAGTEDALDLLDTTPDPVPAAPLALEETDFAAHAAHHLWREPLLFLAERLAESPADTQTLRRWLFPIKAGEKLDETAQHLLATLSIDPQVNFSLAQRQQLWTHLWGLHLNRGDHWWQPGVAPALLEPSEFQASVFNSMRSVLEKTPVASLSLRDCTGICSLAPLADLDCLHALDLRNCTGVTDLTPLACVGSLHQLDLGGCMGISDLMPLAGLDSLHQLDLNGCTGVSDLSPLADLGSLQELSLQGCTSVSDLMPLAGLDSLHQLDLNGCTGVSDLAPLAGLGSLQNLYLHGCTGVSDLVPLSGLNRLQELFLRGCSEVSDLAPLVGLNSLLILTLQGCTGVTAKQVKALSKALPKCHIYD